MAEVMLAKATWLEAARDAGREVPEPRYRPALRRLTRAGPGPDSGVVQPLLEFRGVEAE